MKSLGVAVFSFALASSVGASACGGSLAGGDNDGGGRDGSPGLDASDARATDAGCSLGSTRCSGNGVETCAANGRWGGAKACATQACVEGVCTGVCAPNATRCSGNSVETCAANGQWGTPWPCATGVCKGGACSGSTTTATSCASEDAGLPLCGASEESCCTSLQVNGGTYYRTYDDVSGVGEIGSAILSADGGPTGEADPATVSGFRLDKYLVTVGRFRPFVNAVMATNAGPGGYVPPPGSGKHAHLNGGKGLTNSADPGGYESGWISSDDVNITLTTPNLLCYLTPGYATWTASPGSNENLPINCVNWYEAYAFCIWDGGFLPSEAEWEYVAAGGSQQREFPWGSTAPGTMNQYAIWGCHYNGTGNCTGVTNIAPVGTATRGAGLWGQLDLSGEVDEWNLDSYAPYASCTDCAYLTPASARVNRGGTYGAGDFHVDADLFPPRRHVDAPTFSGQETGLRCARTP